MAGLLGSEDPTWKPTYAPYHISLQGYREATGEVINDHNTFVYTCNHEMRCDMAHKYISRLGPPSIANLP